MKILLLAFTTLLLGVLSAPVNAPPGYETDFETMMRRFKLINDVRRSFAKKYNIANMHQLEHDVELESLSEDAGSRCPEKKVLLAYKHYQYVPVIETPWAPKEKAIQELTAIATTHLMNPVQTLIGVGDAAGDNCKRVGNKEYNTIFVLGPENKEIVKHGAPGSQCNVGSVNKDGLCVKKA